MEHKQPENFDAFEYTKTLMNKMTENERYELDLTLSRHERNRLLDQTDIYMNQNDRYTPEQINELKIYRQDLRNYININKNNIKNKIFISYPCKPSFINS